jgi:hypothetical protein
MQTQPLRRPFVEGFDVVTVAVLDVGLRSAGHVLLRTVERAAGQVAVAYAISCS